MRELTEVLLEKDNPIEIEACTSADVDPLSGTSSHDFKEPHSRGRTQHREPRGRRDSMTPPERDISCASTHTVSSNKKKKTLKETMAQSRSLLAEGRIPGHVSRTTRMTQEPPSTLKGNPNNTRDLYTRQRHDHRHRDRDQH